MKKDFLYYFLDDQGRSFYEKPDGTVGVTGTPTALKSTPDGWQEASVHYGRSNSKPGILRSFTIPLKAVLDGAKILKDQFYRLGISALVNLAILKLNRRTDVHEGYFTGAIDFSQFSDAEYGAIVNVMEGGLSQLVKANEDTTYEIPLKVPEAIDINFDGIELLSNGRLLNFQDFNYDNGEPRAITRTERYINLGMVLSPSETNYPSLLFNDTTLYYSSNTLNPPTDWANNWIFKATADVTATFKGPLHFFLASNFIQFIFYAHKEGANVADDRQIDLKTLNFANFNPRLIDDEIDITVDIQSGESVWFIAIINPGSVQFANRTFVDPDEFLSFDLQYNYRKPATIVKALRPAYVFDQIIKKITNNKYGVSSTILSGEANDFVLTSGDGLRGFEDAVIKTSLNQFITSYNTRFNVGFGIENQVAIIEKKKYFFNDNYLVDLGEVSNLQVAPSLDHIFSAIKIGWPNQTYEDVNGRNEFNTTHEYTTPITRISKVLDLVSSYRADPYGAEFTRINLEGKKTTDSSSDDSVFIINIEGVQVDGKYNLNRPVFDSMTGIISPSTIFNILLSPKRCLLAHGDYIHSGLDNLDAEYIRFQTNNKNDSLVTVKDGVTITEKADVQIGSLPGKLFKPVTFKYDTEVPLNIVDLMDTDPYGKVKISWSDAPYYGYIIECGQVPQLNPSQTFTLLCAPQTDLKQLINA